MRLSDSALDCVIEIESVKVSFMKMNLLLFKKTTLFFNEPHSIAEYCAAIQQ